MVEVLRVSHTYYAREQKLNRSAGESMRLHAELANGGAYNSLRETIRHCLKRSTLEQVGFKWKMSSMTQYNEGHPLEAEQMSIAAFYGRCMMSVIHERWKSLSWHTYPMGLVAGLLDADEEKVKSCMSKLRVLERARLAATSTDMNFFHKLLERSCFKTRWEQLVLLATEADWTLSTELRAVVKDMFSLTQTKCVEDAFRTTKAQASNRSFKKALSDYRMWLNLFESNVAHIQEYKRVGTDAVGGSLRKDDLKGLMTPLVRNVSKPLRAIVGTDATPAWPTLAPHRLVMQREDCQLLLHALEKNNHKDVASSVKWSFLFNMREVAVRKTNHAQSTFYYTFGTVGGSAVMLWPLLPTSVGSKKGFIPDPSADPLLEIIEDSAKWEAVELAWR
eukprot:6465025-Amphidinium_carterae.6